MKYVIYWTYANIQLWLCSVESYPRFFDEQDNPIYCFWKSRPSWVVVIAFESHPSSNIYFLKIFILFLLVYSSCQTRYALKLNTSHNHWKNSSPMLLSGMGTWMPHKYELFRLKNVYITAIDKNNPKKQGGFMNFLQNLQLYLPCKLALHIINYYHIYHRSHIP